MRFQLSTIARRMIGGAMLLALAVPAHADLIVPDYGVAGGSAGVFRFNEVTGAAIGTQPFASIGPADPGYEGATYQAEGSAYGPDGNLYVGFFIAQGNNNTGIGEVRRYNAVTGAYIDTFVQPGAGGLVQPGDLKFRNGQLYVADHGNVVDNVPYGGSSIITYNAGTGATTGAINFGFPAGPSGLAFDPRPATMGGDPNDLYVSLFNSNAIAVYNTVSHTTSTFATGGALFTPSGIAFGPDGKLNVVNLYTASIQQYQEQEDGTGQMTGALTSTGDFTFPTGIAFTQGGKLIVSTLGPGVAPGGVLEYNFGGNTWSTFASSPALYSAGPLTLSPIAGDGNADGVVNAQDIAQVSSHWFSAGPTGDLNHDGVVNAVDIGVIGSNWLHTNSIYGGGGGGAGAAAAVPEPSTFLLGALCGLLGLTGVRRRRRA